MNQSPVARSKVDDYWVTLRFSGDRLDPDYITEIFGVQPTRSCRKGDTFSGKVRDRTEKAGRWEYRIHLRGIDMNLEETINQLLDRFPVNLDVWHELATNFKANLHGSLWFDQPSCAIDFSLETLKRIVERKLSVSSNIYFSPEEDEQL